VAAGEELTEQLEEQFREQTHQDMIGIIAECSRHMLSLINDVLDFERMETKQMKIERIPFNIEEELQKLIKVHSAPAGDSCLHFDC
jgi:signal transduction histidine kinase